MTLHVTEWGGSSASTVLLLHGMLGAGPSWGRVAEAIAARDHRVLAFDLPGHGGSAPDLDLDIPRVVELVTETWGALSSRPPALALGHSYGGTVLAAAIPSLQPHSVVYVDSPFTKRGGWDRELVREEYAASKAARTAEGLRERRPFYSERDIQVEALAAAQFDVETAVGLAAGPGGDWTPTAPPRSLMVRPHPSDYISDETAHQLRARGIEVRDVPGGQHSLWYSHFDAFMVAIDDRY